MKLGLDQSLKGAVHFWLRALTAESWVKACVFGVETDAFPEWPSRSPRERHVFRVGAAKLFRRGA